MTEDLNLRYLEKEWLRGQPAERALQRFQKASDKTLAVLLRHHDETEEGISARETWIRDDFDFLLGFYSIIEIAVMIGLVAELPGTFIKKHLRVLNHPAVRRYYEWNYPLDLPRRLRERILFGIGYDLGRDSAVHSFFYQFLELTRALERDEDMESFLWCLDGGYRRDRWGECDLDAVSRGLGKPQRLAEATQRSPSKRSELDRALNGFCKFIQFCEDLDSLIQHLKGQPELAEAMWLAHGYWFRRLGVDMGSDLRQAVSSLTRWSLGPKDKTALRSRIAEISAILLRLSVPPTTRWKLKLRDRRLQVRIERVREMLEQVKKVRQRPSVEDPIEFDETPAGASE